jgi:hypothetical protein
VDLSLTIFVLESRAGLVATKNFSTLRVNINANIRTFYYQQQATGALTELAEISNIAPRVNNLKEQSRRLQYHKKAQDLTS